MKYLLLVLVMLFPMSVMAQDTAQKHRSKSELIFDEPDRTVPTEKFVAAPTVNPVVATPIYNMNPIIRPDGSFSSPRFLDYNPRANELYGKSGAAIKAYGIQSMKYRNDLERRLDLEYSNMKIRHNWYLRGGK